MSYKIVVDSCCDLPPKYHKDEHFEFIPLGLEIGDYFVSDDENFDQKDYIARVAASETCAKSACPSPDRYMKAYETDADNVYVITLSSKLSGSYNSALLGKDLYHEEKGDKNIFIIDSESASSGEALFAFKVEELEAKGLSFDEIVKQIEDYRTGMSTYFVLDNLDTLRKNGRLTGMKALVASTLNIKPVCGSNHGEIVQRGQGMGIMKALVKMAELIARETKDPAEKILVIAHCNCYERAMVVKSLIEARVELKDIVVVDTAGLSTTYAGDGGIIVAV